MTTTPRSSDTPAGFAPVVFTTKDDGPALVVPASAHTFLGFRDWAHTDLFPNSGKLTFVNNVLLIDMSPAAFEEHGDIVTEVFRVLSQLVRERSLGKIYAENSWITNERAGVSNEPDLFFVSRGTLASGRAKIVARKEMVGSVDWVAEIVSPNSIQKDKQKLRDAYFQAGIDEYWIIDALGDPLELQLLTRGQVGYEPAAPDADGYFASPTYGLSFRLTRDRDDEGYLQYTLLTK